MNAAGAVMVNIIFSILLLYLLLLFGIYRGVFFNSDARKRKTPGFPKGPHYDEPETIQAMTALVDAMESLPYEPVHIRAADGTDLFGRYYEAGPGAPVQIEFHGYRGGACRDMAGADKIAREHGISRILVDERAHGKSGGNVTTFGVREREDCLAWAEYAAKRFCGAPIILSGVSMGASTVLMAADLPLPESVCGIIADSPYTSPKDIIRKCIREIHGTPGIFWPAVRQSAILFGHFDPAACSAVRSAAGTKVPLLLIHGDDDRFVPCSMSREIAEAARKAGARVRLEIFPGGAHGISYLTDVKRYTDTEMDFIESCIQKKEQKPWQS
jgi:pimeloyl-ACP methyl ester carboxylesterase